jgi:hypothetical protein
MHGDERVRFCDECKLNVYNLSALTRPQAEALVAKHEGRLCVRYFQRSDGTIITQDCGGGLRRAMQRTRRLVTAAAGAIFCALLSPFGIGSGVPENRNRQDPPPGQATPVAGQMLMGKPAPQPQDVRGEVAVMGDVAPAPVPLLGVVAPIPPATQPTTQAADPPTTQPAK